MSNDRFDRFDRPLGAAKGCTCAVCMFKHEVGGALEVDTDTYHGTGAIESLEYKVNYLMRALERLAKALRCEKEGTPDDA